MKSTLLLLIIFWILLSCDTHYDTVQCNSCSPDEFVDSISTRVSVYSSYSSFSMSPLHSPNIEYYFCDSIKYFELFEDSKIVDIQGAVFRSCPNDSILRLKLKNYSIVTRCQESIDTLNLDSDLMGTWYLSNITSTNDTIYPPCEAQVLPGIIFSEHNEQTQIALSLGENTCNFDVLDRQDSISIDGHSINIRSFGYVCTLSFAPTNALREFEKNYSHAFGDTLSAISISYHIDRNFLMLHNEANQATLNYYKK